MARKDEMMVATKTASVDVKGKTERITRGQTIVRRGSDVCQAVPHFFERLQVPKLDGVEDASAEPGSRRGE